MFPTKFTAIITPSQTTTLIPYKQNAFDEPPIFIEDILDATTQEPHCNSTVAEETSTQDDHHEQNVPHEEEEQQHNNNDIITSTPTVPAASNSIRTDKSIRLTNTQRRQIAQLLQLNYFNGKLKKGVIKKIAAEHNISRNSVGKFWKELHADITAGRVFNSDRKYKGGKERRVIDLEKVRTIPLKDRSSLTSLAKSMNEPYSTVRRLVQKGKIRSHSNAIKPTLTEANQIARVKWCLEMIEGNPLTDARLFKPMFNVVHIDEKWFFMTKTSQKYYLLPDEDDPHRTCNSKRFIRKVMFLAAVSRPIFSSDGSLLFDGKIGIFPFTYEQPARRASRNRARGTLEVKPIESVTKEVIRRCFIDQIIPAIKSKWPDGASRTIYIQQDNAKPHIAVDDVEFLNAAQSDGFDIRLVCQPPNSPDLNVLDLGFFRSIQTLQHEKAPKTVSELVDAVVTAYEEVETTKLKYVWLSLQCCMNEILKVKGNNNYKIPHIGKKNLETLGLLPEQISVSEDIVKEALQFVEASETT